jgi:hypothetical protein
MQVSKKLIVTSLMMALTLTACEPHQEYVARIETDKNAELSKVPGLSDCRYYQFNNMQVLRCPNSTVDVRHGKYGHDVIDDVTPAQPSVEQDEMLIKVKKCANLRQVFRAYEAAEVDVPQDLKDSVKESCE